VHFLGLCHQYIQKIPSQLLGASYTPGWHQRLLHAGLAGMGAYSQSRKSFWAPESADPESELSRQVLTNEYELSEKNHPWEFQSSGSGPKKFQSVLANTL